MDKIAEEEVVVWGVAYGSFLLGTLSKQGERERGRGREITMV